MRNSKRFTLIFLMLGCVVTAFASRMDEITLIVVPREDSVIQVGMDLATRYPTLLISYKVGVNGAVSLHGWTGTEWVNVTPEAYKEGEFFNNGPSDTILVEKEGQPIPDSLVPSESWCPLVHKIATSETRPLLHLVGQHYNFKYNDWKWFASNYKMPIEDINPEGLNVAWYNKPLGEHLRKTTTTVGTSDLEYWSVVRQPAAEPLAAVAGDEVLVTEDVHPAEDAEKPENLETEDPLTNSIPDAVILGAGDADAEISTDLKAAADDSSSETPSKTVQE